MKIPFCLTQRLFLKIGICLVLSPLLLVGPAEAYESFTISIQAWQGFEMTSGMTALDPTVITIIIGDASEITNISAPKIDPLFEFGPQVDLYFGLTSDPDYPIEVVAEQIVGIAVLEDTPFEDVTDDLLATLDVMERVVLIDHNDLVVLLTHENEYVLLGNVTKYPDATVRFTYWKSETGEIPEASTLVLLGVGLVGLFGIMTRKHQNRSRKGGKFMKHIKTLLLVLVLLPLLVGRAMAAEVRVIRVGTGNGFVKGEHIWCGDQCRATYEEGTVVHLKAKPDPDSRFIGWEVNGQPHEGVLRIEEDTLIKAIFESNTPLHEMTAIYYDGDTKYQATAVLDEMVVFFDYRLEDQIPRDPDEFKAYVQELMQRVHPEAFITDYSPGWMFLRWPEPFTKDQMFALLESVCEFAYVDEADLVFRGNPERRTSWKVLASIYVKYPPHYTEEQIQAIEAEYGLERTAPDTPEKTYVYRVGKHALEALDTARRLYESGLVDWASPDWITPMDDITARPQDEQFQAGKQWNLEMIGLPLAWDITKGEAENGRPSLIAIIDKGVQITHQDLNPNLYDDGNVRSFDFYESFKRNGMPKTDPEGNPIEDADPSPSGDALCAVPEEFEDLTLEQVIQQLTLTQLVQLSDQIRAKHGTKVTGLAAAEGFTSTTGVCGTSPLSKFIAYRLWDFTNTHRFKAKALEKHQSRVDVYNNSWGVPVNEALDFEKGPIFAEKSRWALEQGAEHGRGGKGNIFVFGAGNDIKNSNAYNGYTNSRYTIAVAGSDHTGQIWVEDDPNLELGSDRGAHILLNAPLGAITTNVTCGEPDTAYIENFSGTSAAAPIVSGVVALMLAVNDLKWWEVQHILIETADKDVHPDWDGVPNAASYEHSYRYGFGRINAAEAVEMAESWQVDTLTRDDQKHPVSGHHDPEKGNIVEIDKNLRIDFVEVTFRQEMGSPHNWGDLKIVLISPHGTESLLAEPLTCFELTKSSIQQLIQAGVPETIEKLQYLQFCAEDLFLQSVETAIGTSNYNNLILNYVTYTGTTGTYQDWMFGSVRHFGETSQGTWRLEVYDKNNQPVEEFEWKLQLYGTKFLPPYVKEVEARSGNELIYHAGWKLAGNGQLEWVDYVEPQNLSNNNPLHLTIVTSEAMQWLSLNLFDKDFSSDSTDSTRTLQQADDTGTLWEVTIDPADFPQDDTGDLYTLTFTGQDTGDLYLLPFSNRTPKTLPTHPSDADWPDQPNAGDTVHQIEITLSKFLTWSMTTPTASTCEEQAGGVECLFDDESGSVSLTPTGVDPNTSNLQYLVVDADDTSGTTHTGTYWLPKGSAGSDAGIEFAVDIKPHVSWCSSKVLPETIVQACDEDPLKEEPCQLDWDISVHEIMVGPPQTRRCQVSFIVGEKQMLAEFQSQEACENVVSLPEPNQTNMQGTLETTVTSEWSNEGIQDPSGCQITETITEPSRTAYTTWVPCYLPLGYTENCMNWVLPQDVVVENPDAAWSQMEFPKSTCPSTYPQHSCVTISGVIPQEKGFHLIPWSEVPCNPMNESCLRIWNLSKWVCRDNQPPIRPTARRYEYTETPQTVTWECQCEFRRLGTTIGTFTGDLIPEFIAVFRPEQPK